MIEVTTEDRKTLDAIRAEIDNPNTSRERRSELRDEHASITLAYVIAESIEEHESAATGN